MKNRLLFASFLLVAGCATTPRVPRHTLHWNELKPGMSMTEVRTIAGEPTAKINPVRNVNAPAPTKPERPASGFDLFNNEGMTWEYMDPAEVDRADDMSRALERVVNGPFLSSHVVFFDAQGRVAALRAPKTQKVN
ncbi:MAG: hypothetical protein U1F87_13925 [Kiritimatiellia bacterium]